MLHYYAAINLFDHTLQNIPSLKFILKHPSYYFDPFNCILRLVVLVLGITLGIALYRTTKGVSSRNCTNHFICYNPNSRNLRNVPA